MISYEMIREVQFEASSNCNARCPKCQRNFFGYPMNLGYPEHDMTLDEAKQIFQPDFVSQLRLIIAEGNFGDMQMNPHMIDIWTYLRSIAPKHTRLCATTNGGARDRDFWRALAELGVEVTFAIDGLEDTNHLYRLDVNWRRLMTNAKTFIEAGGRATWKMIEFDHNKHQISQANELADSLGFSIFFVVNQSNQKNQMGRQKSVVFDRSGSTTHVIGPWTGPTDFEAVKEGWLMKPDIVKFHKVAPRPEHVDCEVFYNDQIFINSVGDVFPCCYLAQASGMYSQAGMQSHFTDQIRSLMSRNNATKYTVKECIEWFREVEKSWQRESIAQGRLAQCDHCCGDKQATRLVQTKEKRNAMVQKSNQSYQA